MNASSNPLSMLFLSGSGGDDDSSADPRTQMMRMALLQQMRGGQGGQVGDHGPEGESGGEVGTRHIDQQPPGSASGGKDFISTHPNEVMSQVGQSLPGFDSSTGMPTEFAATPRKEAAAARLEKAESSPDVKPWSTKKKILTSLAAPIPFVGPAVMGAEMGSYNRGRRDISTAQEDYKTEATLEQGQREQAMREKIAMQNMELTKAMKEALIQGQNYRAGISADVGHERNAVGAAKGGYDVTRDANGNESVTPRERDQLSEAVRANIELGQARQELLKAQTSAIPEQIKLKQEALQVAQQRLDLALNNMSFRQDMQREQQDFRESGPTTQLRDRGQQAAVIRQTADGLVKDIQDNAKYLGPIMGRANGLLNFLGAPPPAYAEIASRLITFIAEQPAAHGFKGLRAVQEFEKSYGSPIRTPEALIAAINGGVNALQPMEAASRFVPLRPQAQPNIGPNASPGTGSPRSLLKKGPGNSQAAPQGNGGSNVRSIVRGKNGELTFSQPAPATVH